MQFSDIFESLLRAYHNSFVPQFFFVNLKHENKNSISDFALKTRIKTFVSKISGIQRYH